MTVTHDIDGFRSLFNGGTHRRGPRGPVPAYMRTPPFPREVTEGARCTPDVAWMFAERTREESIRYGNIHVRARIKAAKNICYVCPVRAQCLAHALETKLTGVFGGVLVTEADHRRRRKDAQEARTQLMAERS